AAVLVVLGSTRVLDHAVERYELGHHDLSHLLLLCCESSSVTGTVIKESLYKAVSLIGTCPLTSSHARSPRSPIPPAGRSRPPAPSAARAAPPGGAPLGRLAEGEARVNDLAEPFPITVQAVSQHIKVLERAGLVTRTRNAQLRPSKLDGAALKDAAEWLDRY